MLLSNLFLVGTFPAHVHSVGDHAQTLAVTKLLQEQYPEYVLKIYNRCDVDRFFAAPKSCDDLIFIMSSGDFGDLYPNSWHDVRKKIVASYPDNRVVQLPVSVYYSNPAVFEVDKIFFSNRPNLLVCCRCESDAELLAGCFGCRVMFVPDFVYSLKPKKLECRRRGVLVCLRRDKEYCICNVFVRGALKFTRKPLGFLSKVLGKDLGFIFWRLMRWIDWQIQVCKLNISYGGVTVCDVQTSTVDISDINRQQIVDETFSFYQKFRLVVTDRFHAHVFCSLVDVETQGLKTKIKGKTVNDFPVYDFSKFRLHVEKMFSVKLKEQVLFDENPVLNVILQRRSIRRWTCKPVSEDLKGKVLLAAKFAPSSCSSQSVKVISVSAPDLIKALQKESSVWFHNNAPAWIVVVVVDLNQRVKGEWTKRFVWQDSACAMQNMMLACTGLGLGSCWASVDPVQQENVKRLLGLSENFLVTCMLFAGFSNQNVNYFGAVHQGNRVFRSDNVLACKKTDEADLLCCKVTHHGGN